MKYIIQKSPSLTLLLIMCVLVAGCQTISSKDRLSKEEARQAVKSMGAAMTGRTLTDEQVKQLEEQIKKDPEAQEAIRKIAESISEQPKAKYCPVGGEHYAAHIELCPVHNVKLKVVGE